MKHILLLVFALFLVQFNACMTPNEKFIQGEWMQSGELGDMHAWYRQWKFDNGRYSFEGYPPISSSGTYRVVWDRNDSLQLQLTAEKTESYPLRNEITIAIHKPSLTISIDSDGEYRPLVKSTPQ